MTNHPWASECPDVRNYKWRLNPVWHRMLYSCTHMATVGVEGLIMLRLLALFAVPVQWLPCDILFCGCSVISLLLSVIQSVSAMSTWTVVESTGRLDQRRWTVSTSRRQRSAAGTYTSTTPTTSRKARHSHVMIACSCMMMMMVSRGGSKGWPGGIPLWELWPLLCPPP